MSTKDLEVEFHEHALPSEQRVLDVARDLPLGQVNPITAQSRYPLPNNSIPRGRGNSPKKSRARWF
jgi:hypothetical protein